MEIITLGEKIRNYRTARGISQMELELRINGAFGSISRIENNHVSPTRETLTKIANALSLRPLEIADVIGFRLFTPEQLILAINKISGCLTLEKTLQTSVDALYELYPYYNGGIIFRTKGKKLFAEAISKTPVIDEVLNLLPVRLPELNIDLELHKDNYIARAILEDKVIQSNKIADFSKYAIEDRIAWLIQKLAGFEYGISMPMKYNEEIIGAVWYTKRIKEEFSEEEQRVLRLFTNQMGIAIKNAETFESMEMKIKAATN